jgi:hypothetical protein
LRHCSYRIERRKQFRFVLFAPRANQNWNFFSSTRDLFSRVTIDETSRALVEKKCASPTSFRQGRAQGEQLSASMNLIVLFIFGEIRWVSPL